MSQPDTLDLVGTTIAGKYAIESVAGTGGSATVYRATHQVWGRTVAVKVLRDLGAMGVSARAEVLARLVQEAQLLASLSERTTAIVQAYDIGTLVPREGEWAPYLVLAWLEGSNLEDTLEKERTAKLPPRTLTQAVALLDGAAQALSLAHSRGIAHRDIKPGNIHVVGDARSAEATVKVLDFGIAKVVADAKGVEGFNTTIGDLTSFTPAYGAPEQFSRALGASGPWTDVYGFTLVLLELIVGREVSANTNDIGQLAYDAVRGSVRPSPRQLGLAVTDDVERVFTKALAVRPVDRYRNMAEFWADLRVVSVKDEAQLDALRAEQIKSRLVRTLTPESASLPSAPIAPNSTPSVVTPAQPIMSPRPSNLRFVAIVGVALVATFAVGAFFARKGFRPRVASAMAAPSLSSLSVPTPTAPSPVAAHEERCPAGMVPIPGGKFFIGSDDADAMPFEKPSHKVTLHPYCMDRTEVTVAAYRACSDAGGCKRAPLENEWDGITAAERKAYDPLCNARDPSARAQHPINCVDWELAENFCREQGKRLPTEAEWEFAARGPDGRRYPWGDDPPTATLLNACGSECSAWAKSAHVEVTRMFDSDDGYPNTAPVGSFPAGASRYGLVDVVGNVWEWVNDGYGDYTKDEVEDPKGPASATDRVIRGGAWNGGDAAWVRPTFRYHNAPNVRSHGVGFRCAK